MVGRLFQLQNFDYHKGDKMAYRNGNYSAFYVAEPFSESNLGALATRDFVYYNTVSYTHLDVYKRQE